MTAFADKGIKFNKELDFLKQLNNGIQVMNPFKENEKI